MGEQIVISGEKCLKESCDGMEHYQENTTVQHWNKELMKYRNLNDKGENLAVRKLTRGKTCREFSEDQKLVLYGKDWSGSEVLGENSCLQWKWSGELHRNRCPGMGSVLGAPLHDSNYFWENVPENQAEFAIPFEREFYCNNIAAYILYCALNTHVT